MANHKIMVWFPLGKISEGINWMCNLFLSDHGHMEWEMNLVLQVFWKELWKNQTSRLLNVLYMIKIWISYIWVLLFLESLICLPSKHIFTVENVSFSHNANKTLPHKRNEAKLLLSVSFSCIRNAKDGRW